MEKKARLGGIVDTTIEDGFVVEGGPDSFVTAKGSILELGAELGLESEVVSASPDSGGSYVWWDGNLHPLPGGLLLMVPSRFGPLFSSSLLSWPGKLTTLKDLFQPRSRTEGDESLGSFVRRRLGGEVLERIAEPLIAGIHGADPETMSLQASFPRFLEMEAEHRSLILAARRIAATNATVTTSHFSSFRAGMGQLTDAMISALDDVDIRTGVDATGIAAAGTGYTVALSDGSLLRARGVILAVPAPVASGLLESLVPKAADSLAGIGQVSNHAVTFAYRSDHLPPLKGSGFVIPSASRRRIRGVSYLSRKWEGRVPDDGFSLIRVFFPSGSDRKSLVEDAREELLTMVGVSAKPVRSWVRSHPQGLHRYTLGHTERVARAERALGRSPGIALAGAGFYGVGLNECVQSGWRAAQLILGTDAHSTA